MIEQLKAVLAQAEHIVFFGGAGVSTESNIPDFRSQSGIYSRKTYPYPAEHMISHDFFLYHPKEFYDFYFHEMVYPNAKPNAAHNVLAYLERIGKLDGIVTQNIDGLHQQAGSQRVYELHGSIHRNFCTHCHQAYSLDAMLHQKGGIPRCPKCQGIIKPDVVLYGEALDQHVVGQAIDCIAHAEVMIVGGTSLAVYPAASLLQYFNGHTLILINKDHTPMDARADIVIHDAIGEVLKQAVPDAWMKAADQDRR